MISGRTDPAVGRLVVIAVIALVIVGDVVFGALILGGAHEYRLRASPALAARLISHRREAPHRAREGAVDGRKFVYERAMMATAGLRR